MCIEVYKLARKLYKHAHITSCHYKHYGSINVTIPHICTMLVIPKDFRTGVTSISNLLANTSRTSIETVYVV